SRAHSLTVVRSELHPLSKRVFSKRCGQVKHLQWSFSCCRSLNRLLAHSLNIVARQVT
uniref:IS5/IS1182 family transposase n=1 Tax=Haemonchus contortus TaxID=6289 RepID=A0A7I4YN37_HAECO